MYRIAQVQTLRLRCNLPRRNQTGDRVELYTTKEKKEEEMKLRQFWKAMMWCSKGVAHHPFYKKIRLDDICRVQYMAEQKHERRRKK